MNYKSSLRGNGRNSPLRVHSPSVGALALGSALLAFACGSEQLSLGEGEAPLDTGEPACNGGVVQGSVEVNNQLELEALVGCEEIVGNLWIHAFAGVDLRPLASLRIVRGDLAVGPNDTGFDLVESLEGLEALEQVSRLSIHYLGATDLLPLANLKRVEFDPQSPFSSGGSIDISGCPNLIDLTGLGNLERWDQLSLSGNTSLASLNGIGLPTLGEPAILTQELPALRDVSALAGLERIGVLHLWGTGLEHIAPLGVRIIRNLNLTDNNALVHIDGLAALEVAGISITENDALEHLPEWPALSLLSDVQIVNNASLHTIPQYAIDLPGGGVRLGSLLSPSTNPDVLHRQQFVVFDIGGNPKLRSLALPTGLERGQYVGIYDNASLTTLNLNSITDIDQLSIRNNAALTSVTLGALSAVDNLAVENNPLLPAEAFADVASFTRVITGNASDAP